MKVPYSQVHVHGPVIFAARSGWIDSFNVQDGSHISTWKHPDSTNVEKTEERDGDAAAEPPSKRQKTSEAEDVSTLKTADVAQDGNGETVSAEKGQNSKKAKAAPKSQMSRAPDRPVVIQLTGTNDGRHIVAVTGHDKAVWVFEHDGEGHLKQLSKRIMPKRPNAICIGPGSQIICGDKFGDVYALPLIASDSPAAVAARRINVSKPFTKPTANETTVHSKKNLKSLKAQQKQAEQMLQGRVSAEPKSDAPDFELTLLLGHVSMITSMVLGEIKGKTVILTGDRDEHIRVSRYIPQAYVIEGFCLGHNDFVTAMTIPKARGEILVSAGGDSDMFVWNWQEGSILSRSSILSLAQEIRPDTSKVAVSKVLSFGYTSETGTHTYVLAICEGIKAIFCWQLTEESELRFPSIIQLPGNPLHLALTQPDKSLPSIIAAIDPVAETEAQSLYAYALTLNEGQLAVDTVQPISYEASGSDVLESSADEIQKLLYGIESLRKQTGDAGEEGADEGGAASADAEASDDVA